MKGLIRGTLLGIILLSLIVGLLADSGKVAWVTAAEYKVRSEKSGDPVQCQSFKYHGIGFGHEIVTGQVTLSATEVAYGGYLMRQTRQIPKEVFYMAVTSWGHVDRDGNIRTDDDQVVAGECGQDH